MISAVTPKDDSIVIRGARGRWVVDVVLLVTAKGVTVEHPITARWGFNADWLLTSVEVYADTEALLKVYEDAVPEDQEAAEAEEEAGEEPEEAGEEPEDAVGEGEEAEEPEPEATEEVTGEA